MKRSRSRTHHRQICTSSAFLPWRRFWPKIEEFRSFFYVIKQKVTLYYHKHSSFATLIGTETFQQFHEQPGTLKLYLVNWEAVLPKQMAYFIVWQQCQVHKKNISFGVTYIHAVHGQWSYLHGPSACILTKKWNHSAGRLVLDQSPSAERGPQNCQNSCESSGADKICNNYI